MPDFKTNVPGSIVTEAQRFCQEGYLELKCYKVPIYVEKKCGGGERQSAPAKSSPSREKADVLNNFTFRIMFQYRNQINEKTNYTTLFC